VRLAYRLALAASLVIAFAFAGTLGPPATSDETSPPGCVVVVGEPTPTTCLPCPPLWLGGPTVRCVDSIPTPDESPRAELFPPLWATDSADLRAHLMQAAHSGGSRLVTCGGEPLPATSFTYLRSNALVCGGAFPAPEKTK
jgi:hypothetical protein